MADIAVFLELRLDEVAAALLDQHPLESFTYKAAEKLLYIRFANEPSPRRLTIQY